MRNAELQKEISVVRSVFIIQRLGFSRSQAPPGTARVERLCRLQIYA